MGILQPSPTCHGSTRRRTGSAPPGQAQPGGSKAMQTSREGFHTSNQKKQENHQKALQLQQTIASPKHFKAHFQSTPSPTRAVAVIVYHTAASGNRLPGGQKFSCHGLQQQREPKERGQAAQGDSGPKGGLRDDASCNKADSFITGSQNYSGNHRGSNWKLLDRETSPFCFQMCRPISLH